MLPFLFCYSAETSRQGAADGFDVMLRADTHGGQNCLPGGLTLVKVRDGPYGLIKGSWRYLNLYGYISVGTGSCGVPLRFFCPPEITIHRLSDDLW